MKTSMFYPSKEICWLCCSTNQKFPYSNFEFAAFKHRMSALIYAYCISNEIEDIDPEDIQLKNMTDDPDSMEYSWQIIKRGNRSVHFHGSYCHKSSATSAQVVPVLIDAEIGSHVEITTMISRRCESRRIERIRRLNVLESENYPKQIDREGTEDFWEWRYRCKYISTLISCPKHLLDNSEKNIDTNYFSVTESLYPLDIVTKLGDIMSVILLSKTGLHQPDLLLYFVDRIASFLSIEDVLRLLHYGLPSKNDFDRQKLREDIFYSLPNSLISVPFESVFRTEKEFVHDDSEYGFMDENGFLNSDGWDESSVLNKSSEEFWILYNESLRYVAPSPYLKNEMKVNDFFRPLFVIPVEYEIGYIRNSISRVRSFLVKKNALHLIENEIIKIQTVSRMVRGSSVSFIANKIQAIFTDQGSRCSWWYSGPIPAHTRRLQNVDWDDETLYIHNAHRRQIIMLTEECVGEDINETLCEISRVEKYLPQGTTLSESDILQVEADEVRYTEDSPLRLIDPYEPYRVRLGHHLMENFETINKSYVANGSKFNLLSDLWKLLADTFGISNYSIIKSEDEITPTTVLSDLVVISFRDAMPREWPWRSWASGLRLASAHCFRNNKSSIISSVAKADDDETPCVRLNVLQLWWQKEQTLSLGKAKIDISRSGRVLNLCNYEGSNYLGPVTGQIQVTDVQNFAPMMFLLIEVLMFLKYRPVQVWFPEQHLDFSCSAE